MDKFFLTFGFVGLLKPAPGTWASLVGATLAYFFLKFFPPLTLLLLAILIFLISIKIIDKFEEKIGIHDSKIIVIDEIVGIFVAVSMCGGTIIGTILAFIFFRIYDIFKPSIIGVIDKKVKGGLGVMSDDLLAGAIAGISVLIIAGIVEKFALGIKIINF